METHNQMQSRQPVVVKYVQLSKNGIQSINFTRHAIGYVVHGSKYIYYGDVRYEIAQGELFYLSRGNHYIEDVPEAGKYFEQIVFYYSPEQLSNILSLLNLSYNLDLRSMEAEESARSLSHESCLSWSTMRNFFGTVTQYIRDDLFSVDQTAEKIKMTELLYLILVKPDCYLKARILNNVDTTRESFDQIVNTHIFSNVSLEELADKCNRSLTSFKKDFQKHFNEPPHKWFIRQRLMHSHMLLISTGMSVSEIGNECYFRNTSHYIKLFKKEYGTTPANYRRNFGSINKADVLMAVNA